MDKEFECVEFKVVIEKVLIVKRKVKIKRIKVKVRFFVFEVYVDIDLVKKGVFDVVELEFLKCLVNYSDDLFLFVKSFLLVDMKDSFLMKSFLVSYMGEDLIFLVKSFFLVYLVDNFLF